MESMGTSDEALPWVRLDAWLWETSTWLGMRGSKYQVARLVAIGSEFWSGQYHQVAGKVAQVVCPQFLHFKKERMCKTINTWFPKSFSVLSKLFYDLKRVKTWCTVAWRLSRCLQEFISLCRGQVFRESNAKSQKQPYGWLAMRNRGPWGSMLRSRWTLWPTIPIH